MKAVAMTTRTSSSDEAWVGDEVLMNASGESLARPPRALAQSGAVHFLTWRDIKVRYKQDRSRRGVGRARTTCQHHRLHAFLQPRRQHLVGRHSLPGLRTRGPRSLDVLRQRDLVGSIGRRERERGHEGLLFPPDNPEFDSALRVCPISWWHSYSCSCHTGVAPSALIVAFFPAVLLLVIVAALGGLVALRAEREVPGH